VAILALVSRLQKFLPVRHIATERGKLNYINLALKDLRLVAIVQTGEVAQYLNCHRFVPNYTK
jgi:hypothetical protein